MASHSFLAIAAAAAGGAIVREVIAVYFERKAKRTEIELVPDGKGGFVDKAKIFERRVFFGYLGVVALVVIFGNLAVIYS